MDIPQEFDRLPLRKGISPKSTHHQLLKDSCELLVKSGILSDISDSIAAGHSRSCAAAASSHDTGNIVPLPGVREGLKLIRQEQLRDDFKKGVHRPTGLVEQVVANGVLPMTIDQRSNLTA